MTANWVGVVVLGAAVALPAAAAWAQQDSRDRRDYYQRDNRGPRETETVNKTVAFPDKGTLRLNNFSGDVPAGVSRRGLFHAARRTMRPCNARSIPSGTRNPSAGSGGTSPLTAASRSRRTSTPFITSAWWRHASAAMRLP